MGLAAVAGPIIGGALVDGDLFGPGWRSIFLVNVPLGIIGAGRRAAGAAAEPRASAGTRLDPGGVLLVTARVVRC